MNSLRQKGERLVIDDSFTDASIGRMKGSLGVGASRQKVGGISVSELQEERGRPRGRRRRGLV